jgi:hypothetical protein
MKKKHFYALLCRGADDLIFLCGRLRWTHQHDWTWRPPEPVRRSKAPPMAGHRGRRLRRKLHRLACLPDFYYRLLKEVTAE